MGQDSSNYLNGDSNFGVPIILNSDGLESFATSSITDQEDEARNVESGRMDSLDLKFSEADNLDDLENDVRLEGDNLDDSSLPDFASDQAETKSGSNQNLKVKALYNI